MSTVVSSSSSSAPQNPANDPEDQALPEHLVNPANMVGLVKKANLLLKPHLDHNQKPASPTGRAIAAIIEATTLVARGKREKANTDYYDRLLNQVVQGKRDITTLCANVDGVPGINSEFARLIGVPLPTVSPPSAPVQTPNRRGQGRSASNVRPY